MTCDIIDYRQNEEKQIHATKQKTPEVALQGLFLPFLVDRNETAFYYKRCKNSID